MELTESNQTAEDLDELKYRLICDICLNVIEDPRLLDCLHSFCFNCLVLTANKLENDTITINCAKCNQLNEFKCIKDIELLPTDPIKANCLRRYLSQVTVFDTQPCYECDKYAIGRCQTCCVAYCCLHSEAHCTSKRTNTHLFVRFESNENKQDTQKHQKSDYKLFCIDCASVQTHQSARSSHDQHVCVPIEIFRQTKVKQIKEFYWLLDEKLDSIEQQKLKLTDCLQLNKQIHQTLCDRIETYFNELQQAIKQCYQDLITTANNLIDIRTKQIENDINQLNYLQSSIETSKSYFEQTQSINDPLEFIAIQTAIWRRFTDLQTTQITKSFDEDLVPEFHQTIDKTYICEAIKSNCVVKNEQMNKVEEPTKSLIETFHQIAHKSIDQSNKQHINKSIETNLQFHMKGSLIERLWFDCGVQSDSTNQQLHGYSSNQREIDHRLIPVEFHLNRFSDHFETIEIDHPNYFRILFVLATKFSVTNCDRFFVSFDQSDQLIELTANEQYETLFLDCHRISVFLFDSIV